MYNHYKQQENFSNALATVESLHHLKDSIYQASEKVKLSEIQYRFDRQAVENKLYKISVITLVGIHLIFILTTLSYNYHRRKIKGYNNLLSTKEFVILKAQKQIKELENSGEEHHEEIKLLYKQIETIKKQTYEQLGLGHQIYDKILNGGLLAATDNEHYLIEYYSVFHYEAYQKWMIEYKGLSARFITYLILHDMGKTDLEIGQILCVSRGAIRTLKSRLNNKKRS